MAGITFTREIFARFKQEYKKADGLKQTQFTFDGHLLVTGYAKYLIEHLESKFNVTTTKRDYQRPA